VALPGRIERARLANGLEVCLLANHQAPVVSTALFYAVGCRDEGAGQGGISHFLEHMMFKGSERYAAGEVDRRTQALGGVNNAFTSHDVTAYWFSFAADRWGEALAIEADRMRGLRLDPREVEAERRVILEEIEMYRDDPWDVIEQAVQEALFEGHPYGRPILGTPEELAGIGAAELAAWHRDHYRPRRAILVVAGDPGDGALERVAEAFGAIEDGAVDRPTTPAARRPEGAFRVERFHGEVNRFLWAFPAPAADAPEHAALRLVAGILAEGRASRLQRALVDEGQLCLGVSASLSDAAAASSFQIAAELLPGADPAEVEAVCRAALDALGEPVDEPELERARHVFFADWVHGIEKIHQQAVAAGIALAQFDLDQPERLLAAVEAATPDALAAAVRTWLDPGRSVLALCRPRSERPVGA